MVVAYKNVNGQKMTISAAVVVHTNTKGGKVTVAKSLKVTDTKKKAVTKVTVKKGLKKGTYKVKVSVKAAGNDKYNPITKKVTFTIKVKK